MRGKAAGGPNRLHSSSLSASGGSIKQVQMHSSGEPTQAPQSSLFLQWANQSGGVVDRPHKHTAAHYPTHQISTSPNVKGSYDVYEAEESPLEPGLELAGRERRMEDRDGGNFSSSKDRGRLPQKFSRREIVAPDYTPRGGASLRFEPRRSLTHLPLAPAASSRGPGSNNFPVSDAINPPLPSHPKPSHSISQHSVNAMLQLSNNSNSAADPR